MDDSDKLYLSGTDVLRDSFRLARMIDDSRWDPDVLAVLWRGGASVGIAIHEYFVYQGHRKTQAIVKCASYDGLQRTDQLTVEFSDPALEQAGPGVRILVIDDVFDTGRTAMRVRRLLEARGAEVRLAMLYWKPTRNQTDGRPDYFLHATDQWIVFPHELDGLTPDELQRKDPEIFRMLHGNTHESQL